MMIRQGKFDFYGQYPGLWGGGFSVLFWIAAVLLALRGLWWVGVLVVRWTMYLSAGVG